MVHVLKILEQYADAIADSRKNFEVRINDRGYNAGDTVKFIVKDDMGVEVYHHPITGKNFEITYVHSGLGMESGYVVFGIKEIVDKADVVEMVQAHWIVDFAWNGWMDWTCSHCGYRENIDVHEYLDYNFCPKCGATMKRREDEQIH